MSLAVKPVKQRNDAKANLTKKLEAERQKAQAKQVRSEDRQATAGRTILKRKIVNEKSFLLGKSLADQEKLVSTIKEDPVLEKWVATYDYVEPFLVSSSVKINTFVETKTEKFSAGFWLDKWHFAFLFLLPRR